MDLNDIPNSMTLDEYEAWVSSGKSVKDATFGLLFKAIQKYEGKAPAEVPFYMELAGISSNLLIAEELEKLRWAIEQQK